MHRLHRLALAVGLSLVAAGSTASPKPATENTARHNAGVLDTLDFTDRQSFEDARRGFIAALDNGEVRDDQGNIAWQMRRYDFLDHQAAPETVNPSLWRQAQLNNIHGLFKVADGMYQIRGMDLANMTIVESATGVIIIDPLLTPATARAGLQLYFQHRPQKPVKAVIYTHSHVDHFGGVKGIISQEQVDRGEVEVIAPEGFMEHAISENVIAGNAMTRRATYMYGTALPVGEQGHVDTGLGKGLARGPKTLIAPTRIIDTDGEQAVDGLEIDFILASGSEAPAEMMMYFPAARVLNTAEITSRQLHNVYTPRGAEVRDASLWSRQIDEVLDRFGARADIIVAQHHWPVWGQERGQQFLRIQRDLYKYIHDQSVRLMNLGYKPAEIAESLVLPDSLASQWDARGYYGTLRHNARAIYQKYLGWYDANPANLDPLPPTEEARRIIGYMGGMERVIERAREDFDRGDYRWVASIMNHAVFAEPDNQQARQLAADALEQLGYQAESGVWRDIYLSGALELRNGIQPVGGGGGGADLLQALETGMFFDVLGVRLNGPKAQGKHIVLNWHFTDTDETFRLNLENAALTWLPGRTASDAHASIELSRETLNAILSKRSNFPDAIRSGAISITGERKALIELLGLIEEPAGDFALVEPLQ